MGQRDFERLGDAKRSIDTLPRGTVVKVTDLQAGPRDGTMTYLYISVERVWVQHGPLRTAPLSDSDTLIWPTSML
jgi:hypothetical protein